MGRWASDPLRILLRLANRNVTFHVNVRCDGVPRPAPPLNRAGNGVFLGRPSESSIGATMMINGKPVPGGVFGVRWLP